MALVQPLLATGLVLALVLGAATGARPSRGQWLAAGAAALGLALFLVAAAPAAGPGRSSGPALPLATAGALALLALALALRRAGAPHPAAALGTAAGAGLGVAAPLLKQVVSTPLAALPGSWAPYALLVLGGSALALTQEAFAAGPLVESLPGLSVLEPLVAVALGALALGEGLAGGPAARLGEAAGLVLAVGGVLGLSLRTPTVGPLPVPIPEDLP